MFDAEMRDYILWCQKEARKATEFYVKLAETKLNTFIPMPEIRFSELGTTAGQAWIGRNIIEYNPRILRLNAEDFLKQTTGHEVAHLIAHAKFDSDWHRVEPHGIEWTKVMWVFQLPAHPCHNYDTGLSRPRKIQTQYETGDGRKIVEKRGIKIIKFEE